MISTGSSQRWTTQWQAASPRKGRISLPARRLSVRKIKEVLRSKFEVGLGLRKIARSCSIGLGTAHEYLQRAEAAKITWPLGPEWDDDRLEAALFGGPPRSRPTVLPMPDFADLHRQRQRHPHLTQQLLWEEYRRANPDGYRYSRFCELYKRWRRRDRKSTRLNSSHSQISYAVFCLKKKKK